MSVPFIDPCWGPAGVICAAVGDAGELAVNTAFNAMGNAFVSAAQAVVGATFSAIDATTRVDLGASWFRSNLGLLAAVALPVIVGLFALQIIGSVLRREPGGLARALLGVGKAVLGSAVAIAVTKVALRASDGICAAIASTTGHSVAGAARRFFDLTWMTTPGPGPTLQMLLSIAVMIGALLLWGVLLFRKAALLMVVVFAPVAFAGSAWDHTRIWTRRWIEAVVALVFCKVVIVMIFALGVAAFDSNGRTATGGAQPLGTSLSDVLVGLLLLSIAVFSPWLTWRFVHWSGVEAGTALHREMTATPVPAAVSGGMQSGKFAAQSAATTILIGAATGGSGTAATAATSAVSAGGQAPKPSPAPPAFSGQTGGNG